MAASLPIPPQQPQISKICANCFVYEWKQLEPAALKNCSRCKVVRYCGADCQVEHWKVLHHKHCRKLAEARKEVSRMRQQLKMERFRCQSAGAVDMSGLHL